MIENPNPSNWRHLQKGVCQLFNEIGLTAEESKEIITPRGKVEVDVFAVDENSVEKIRYVVECKNWSKSIPQSVVHSFTTIMHETGANIGFIISQKKLQKGAFEYTNNTNITGLTYSELQVRYFKIWIYKHFSVEIAKYSDSLLQYIEVFNSFRDRQINELSKNNQRIYHELVKKYYQFGMIVGLYHPTLKALRDNEINKEIQDFKERVSGSLDNEFKFSSIYYRDLLSEIIVKVIEITDEFNDLFGKDIFLKQ